MQNYHNTRKIKVLLRLPPKIRIVLGTYKNGSICRVCGYNKASLATTTRILVKVSAFKIELTACYSFFHFIVFFSRNVGKLYDILGLRNFKLDTLGTNLNIEVT